MKIFKPNIPFFFFPYSSCWVWAKWRGSFVSVAAIPPSMSARALVKLQSKGELRFALIRLVSRVLKQQKGEIFQYVTQLKLYNWEHSARAVPSKAVLAAAHLLPSTDASALALVFSWAVCDLELPAGSLLLLLLTEWPQHVCGLFFFFFYFLSIILNSMCLYYTSHMQQHKKQTLVRYCHRILLLRSVGPQPSHGGFFFDTYQPLIL